MEKDPVKPAWIAVGWQHLLKRLVLISCDKDQEACKRKLAERQKSGDVPAIVHTTLVFNLTSRSGMVKFRQWLIECGMPPRKFQSLAMRLLEHLKPGNGK